MIYFDNASTTLTKPPSVAESVLNAINSFGNSSRGFHEPSLLAARTILDTRYKIANLFNMDNPMNVAFTSNATESLNIAINATLNYNSHVITTELEHNSVLRPIYNSDASLSILKAEKNSDINYSNFDKLLRSNTKAVVCTHGSNLTGNILDISYIGNFCKNNNLIFVLDASQTAGFAEIDMAKNNIDILCFTGHKSLLGPQGIGGICIKDTSLLNLKPFKVGGTGSHSFDKEQPSNMPDIFEAGTINSHAIAGLNASISYIEEKGIKNIQKHELELTNYFYENIKNINGIKVIGSFKNYMRCPIVSLNFKDMDSGDLSYYLYENYNIITRSGIHCAPLLHKALGTSTQGAVRFSFSCFNTKEEVDVAIKALKEI